MTTPEGLCTKCSATQYCAEHEPVSPEGARSIPSRSFEVFASYVLGGWAKRVEDERDLLAVVREGLELSPVAEVTVRISFAEARAADAGAVSQLSETKEEEDYTRVENQPLTGSAELPQRPTEDVTPTASEEAWRLDDAGALDDVVVPHVETFRLERMNNNAWWIGLYLADGRLIHVDLVAGRRSHIVASRRDD